MSTISAHDIHIYMHAQATKREWNAVEAVGADGQVRISIYGDGQLLGTLQGKDARPNANLIVHMRNTLPEHMRSFEHLRDRIQYLERRVRELEEQTKEMTDGKHHHQARG